VWAHHTQSRALRGFRVFGGTTQIQSYGLKAQIRYSAASLERLWRPSDGYNRQNPCRHLALAALSAETIANYRDKSLNEPGRAGTTSNNTVRLKLALLSHVFTVAIQEWGLGLTFNPVLNERKPSPGEGRNRRLSPDEERRLFAEVTRHSNPMLGWIVGIALEPSMRSGEIASLRRPQVDTERRIVRLVDTKNYGQRTVPLSKRATALFKAAMMNPPRPSDCNLVFYGEPGRDGTRRPYTFTQIWGLLVKKLQLFDFRFHDLRHEAVSRLVEGGLSDQEVSSR